MKRREEVLALADALEGMPVWGVLHGSAADEAGIRYGDVILEINGHRTRTLEEFFAARDLAGAVARVVFFRDGQHHQAVLNFEPRPTFTLAEIARELREQRLLPVPVMKRCLELN